MRLWFLAQLSGFAILQAPVTPEEKAAIEAQAAALNLSTSEMVRRAVASYDTEFDEAEFQALADELHAVAVATEKTLDAALAQLDALEFALADKEPLRREARAELEAEGVVWPFGKGQHERFE